MKKVQQGFTLIELMIVVAIIGILAAIAIPQYTDYIQRSKLSGAVAAMDSAKTAIAECVQFTSALAGCTAGNTTYGIPANLGANQVNYVASSAIADGVIVVTSTGVTPGGGALVVTMTPVTTATAITWSFAGSGCSTPGRSIPCGGT